MNSGVYTLANKITGRVPPFLNAKTIAFARRMGLPGNNPPIRSMEPKVADRASDEVTA